MEYCRSFVKMTLSRWLRPWLGNRRYSTDSAIRSRHTSPPVCRGGVAVGRPVVPSKSRLGSGPHPWHPAAEPLEWSDMHQWVRYVPRDVLFCVVEASCCEEYILCSEGAEFFVVRRLGRGKYEETARGSYPQASKAWTELSGDHAHKRAAAPILV
jgi:hypothetical protein